MLKRTREEGMKFWIMREEVMVPLSKLWMGASLLDRRFSRDPDASFPSSDTCNFAEHFDDYMIVFNTTFCVSIRLGFVAKVRKCLSTRRVIGPVRPMVVDRVMVHA